MMILGSAHKLLNAVGHCTTDASTSSMPKQGHAALVVVCNPCYSAVLRFARIAMQPRENVYESRNLRHWYGVAHGRTHGCQQRLAGRTAASVGHRAAAGLHARGPSRHAQRRYLPGP